MLFAEDTVEEAECANVRLCGTFFRQWIDPLSLPFARHAVDASLIATRSSASASASEMFRAQIAKDVADAERSPTKLVRSPGAGRRRVAEGTASVGDAQRQAVGGMKVAELKEELRQRGLGMCVPVCACVHVQRLSFASHPRSTPCRAASLLCRVIRLCAHGRSNWPQGRAGCKIDGGPRPFLFLSLYGGRGHGRPRSLAREPGGCRALRQNDPGESRHGCALPAVQQLGNGP